MTQVGQDGPLATIRIEHPFGASSILGFNGANHVKIGDFVEAGQKLGSVEKNGPDLLWKIHKDVSV